MVEAVFDDPLDGIIKGHNFVNGLFDHAAQLQAGRAYQRGDVRGAAGMLASRGDFKQADALNSQATTTAVLTAANSGDYAGARAAAAQGGDAALYGQTTGAQEKDRAQRLEWMGHATDALLQVGAGLPPDQQQTKRQNAFQQLAPTLKAMGLPDDQISQLGTPENLTDEHLNAFKTTIGQMTSMDVQTTPDGDVLGIDKRTGQVKVLHHSTPKPIVAAPGSTVLTFGDGGWEGSTAGAAAGGAAPASDTSVPSGAPVQASPDDRNALIQMVAGEAGNQPSEGMAAVAHVALNRVAQGYGGAKSVRDVVYAPHQFEAITSGRKPGPQALQKAAAIVDDVLGGKIADPTGGAINFLNPTLQAKEGRAQPAWAPGNGQRIGDHVFYGGGRAAAVPSQAASARVGDPSGWHVAATVPDRPKEQWEQLPDGRQRNTVTGKTEGAASARAATAQEKARFGIAADVPAQIKADGSIDVISGTGAALKPVPMQVQAGIIKNRTAIQQIDQTIAAINGDKGALGLHNALPAGLIQRLPGKEFSGGVDVRARLANIGSLLIHDRSGAAVTASEQPRLRPFVPTVTDDWSAAIKKLKALREQYVSANSEAELAYGPDSGYRPMARSPSPAPARAKSASKPDPLGIR